MPRKLEVRRKHASEKFERLRPLLPIASSVQSWLQYARQSLGMTMTQLAKRNGVTQQAINQVLRKEEDGEVTIKKIRQLADSMGFTFAYFLVPKQPLNDLVWSQAKKVASETLEESSLHMELENQSVNTDREEDVEKLAKEILYDRALWEKE